MRRATVGVPPRAGDEKAAAAPATSDARARAVTANFRIFNPNASRASWTSR